MLNLTELDVGVGHFDGYPIVASVASSLAMRLNNELRTNLASPGVVLQSVISMITETYRGLRI